METSPITADGAMPATSLDQAAVHLAMRVAPVSDISQPIELFAGEGEMRAAFRRHDWSATPLGAEGSWSPALRSSLLHIFWSAFPNLILWGPDLVQLYNESYLDLLGDQRFAGLGVPAQKGAPHEWDINAPIYARVRAGETISREGALFSVTRSGKAEQLYLTLSYVPILDESAKVAGVLVTVFEAEEEVSVQGREFEHHRDMPPRGRQSEGSIDRIRRPPGSLAL